MNLKHEGAGSYPFKGRIKRKNTISYDDIISLYKKTSYNEIELWHSLEL